MHAMNAAIRILTSAARDQIARHMTHQSAEDRALRFGAALDDAAIGNYVAGINFARDKLFGVFEEGDALVGVAHLRLEALSSAAWLGISVAAASRCRGYGYALLCVAALQARRAGRGRLMLPGLAENPIVVHLARKAGLSVIDELGKAGTQIALGKVPQLHRLHRPAHASAGRKVRTLVIGALLPIFSLDMALMLAVSAACDSCKRPAVVSQR
jgi:GNAT superfamily N-acetyltransferase